MQEALVPVAVSRFSPFITVNVENVYSSKHCIPYVVLYRGKGNGLIEMAKMCLKKIEFQREEIERHERMEIS